MTERDVHRPELLTQGAYWVAYICSCGWQGQEWPSVQLGSAGREMVAHIIDTGEGQE